VALDGIKNEKITAENINLIPMETVVQNMPALTFSETELKRLSQGQRLSWHKLDISQAEGADGIYCVKVDQKTLGLVKKEGTVIRSEFIWANTK